LVRVNRESVLSESVLTKFNCSPSKLCDGAEMAIFGDFFASCICS